MGVGIVYLFVELYIQNKNLKKYKKFKKKC